MCGRFNVTSDPLSQLLMDLVGLTHPGQDNFNLAPTERVHVVRVDDQGAPEVVAMRWWLTPFWAKELTAKYAMFNAKSETAAKSPAFREAYRRRRCVVPVSGFYEWAKAAKAGGPKTPYFILPQQHEGMLLAGLWDSWRVPASESGKAGLAEGEELLSFTILTTAANESLKFVHARQPVMLSPDEARQWLEVQTPTAALTHLFESRLPMELTVLPVSSHVNNARNKDERCMQPLAAGQTIPATH